MYTRGVNAVVVRAHVRPDFRAWTFISGRGSLLAHSPFVVVSLSRLLLRRRVLGAEQNVDWANETPRGSEGTAIVLRTYHNSCVATFRVVMVDREG